MSDETKKHTKIDTINELKELWQKNPELTNKELSAITGYSVSYIDNIWRYVTGYRSTDELVSQNYIMSVRPNENRMEKTINGTIHIPSFKPTAKDFIDRTGKKCKDVSEFYGIIENGGECYRDVRYTIPKGNSDSYGNSISDYYI